MKPIRAIEISLSSREKEPPHFAWVSGRSARVMRSIRYKVPLNCDIIFGFIIGILNYVDEGWHFHSFGKDLAGILPIPLEIILFMPEGPALA